MWICLILSHEKLFCECVWNVEPFALEIKETQGSNMPEAPSSVFAPSQEHLNTKREALDTFLALFEQPLVHPVSGLE